MVIAAIHLQLVFKMELDKQTKQKGAWQKKKDFTTVKRSFPHPPIVEGKSSARVLLQN